MIAYSPLRPNYYLQVRSCHFSGNVATAAMSYASRYASELGGGALRLNRPGIVSILDSLFEENHAGAYGGAVLWPEQTCGGYSKIECRIVMRVNDTRFIKNSATTVGLVGGKHGNIQVSRIYNEPT